MQPLLVGCTQRLRERAGSAMASLFDPGGFSTQSYNKMDDTLALGGPSHRGTVKASRDFYHNWTNSILQQLKRKFWNLADALFRISWIDD
jgi:hypothetical protein